MSQTPQVPDNSQLRLFGGAESEPPATKKAAQISECGHYRWWLQRELPSGVGNVVFIGLNPSIADAYKDDPTIRRCIGFARSWGYRFVTMVNLFPFRSTEPKGLLTAPVDVNGGLQGLAEVVKAAKFADRTVAAWGDWVPFGKDVEVCTAIMAVKRPLFCLGLTKNGRPRHPLYVLGTTQLQPFQLKEPDVKSLRKIRKP